jgi:hypothetical protein
MPEAELAWELSEANQFIAWSYLDCIAPYAREWLDTEAFTFWLCWRPE